MYVMLRALEAVVGAIINSREDGNMDISVL